MKKIMALVIVVIVTIVGMQLTTNHMMVKAYSGEVNPNSTMDVVGMQIAVLWHDHKIVSMAESRDIITSWLMLDSFIDENEESI